MKALLPLVAVSLFVTVACGIKAPEKALAKHLLETYEELGVEGRPVEKVSDAVKIGLGLSLMRILKVERGWVTLSALLELEWDDPFLEWEPKKFGGAESIALPADDIWTPDVSVWNDYHQNVDEQGDEMEEADLLVHHDGKVQWVPRMTYKIPCREDPKVANQQICEMMLGSWVHDTDKLDFDFDDNEADVDLDFYEPTAGIQLVAHSAKMEEETFECCPDDKYSVITFSFTVKKTASTKKEEL